MLVMRFFGFKVKTYYIVLKSANGTKIKLTTTIYFIELKCVIKL